MKKVLFFLGLLSICAIAVDAATTTTTRYFGKRAGGKDNPCKGATTRTCAVVVTTTDCFATTAQVLVTETVKYAEGDEFTIVTQVENSTPEAVMQEIISRRVQNGGYVESSN